MQFFSWFLRGEFIEFDGWEVGRRYVTDEAGFKLRAIVYVYQTEDNRIIVLREQYEPYRRDDVYEFPNLDAAKASEWGWALDRLMCVDINALGGFE